MIVRQSLNTDHAHAYGFVFKLRFSIPNGRQPQLEIFLDNEITQSQDWAIYGVGGLSEAGSEPPEIFAYLSFDEIGQAKYFELGQRFRIELTDIGQEEINYRRTGKMLEPAYHFRVEALDDCGP